MQRMHDATAEIHCSGIVMHDSINNICQTKNIFAKRSRGFFETYLQTARDYAEYGCLEEAMAVLQNCPVKQPMIYYYQAYYQQKADNKATVDFAEIPGEVENVTGKDANISVKQAADRESSNKLDIINNQKTNEKQNIVAEIYRNALPGGKAGGVLTPGSKQLPQGQHNAVLLIPVLDGAQQLLAHRYTVCRGSNPRN